MGNNIGNNMRGVTNTNDDNDTDWGWIGLAGLLGLLGLRRREWGGDSYLDKKLQGQTKVRSPQHDEPRPRPLPKRSGLDYLKDHRWIKKVGRPRIFHNRGTHILRIPRILQIPRILDSRIRGSRTRRKGIHSRRIPHSLHIRHRDSRNRRKGSPVHTAQTGKCPGWLRGMWDCFDRCSFCSLL